MAVQFEKDEHTLTIVRKHWFALFRECLALAVIYLLPLLAYWFITALPSLSENSAVPQIALSSQAAFFLFVVWTFLAWIRLFSTWTDYYLDTWTVTSKRIIDVEQEGFFRRRVGSFRIEKIQDITVSIDGFIPSMLNFGTIHVETAGGDTTAFSMKDIANPKELKDLINQEIDRVVERYNPSTP